MATKKFLVFVRSSAGKQPASAPADMQQMRAAFVAWQEKFKSNLVDLGGRLKPGGKVLTAAGVTDGPFAEAKEAIGGFMVVAAEDYDGAVDVAKACPGLVGPASTVEIREIMTP